MPTQMNDAAGRVAIVTGGSQGLGYAIALLLAKDGADIAIWNRNKRNGEAVAAEITAMGRRAVAVQADVTDFGQVGAGFRQTLSVFGKVDILVNNAGWTAPLQPFRKSDPAAWREIIEADLLSVFSCTKVALEHMEPRGYGRIICIGSDAARIGRAGHAVYAAAKGGVMGFVRSVAAELARSGITINCVSPTITETPLLRRNMDEQSIAREVAEIPVGRLGRPEDIANAVAFLATEASGYITGQTLSVNGGRWRFA